MVNDKRTKHENDKMRQCKVLNLNEENSESYLCMAQYMGV